MAPIVSQYLFVIWGPSGVGKTTVLRHMERRLGVETAPKFTTRPTRNTPDDERDFIFCTQDDFPPSGILCFESYGHLFGIQLSEIDSSLHRDKSHAIIVGDNNVVTRLSEIYADKVISLFIFCRSAVLKSRLRADALSHRAERWAMVRAEIEGIYDQIGGIDVVIDNSGSEANTIRKLENLFSRLGGRRA